jgi:hypothetical protein
MIMMITVISKLFSTVDKLTPWGRVFLEKLKVT